MKIKSKTGHIGLQSKTCNENPSSEEQPVRRKLYLRRGTALPALLLLAMLALVYPLRAAEMTISSYAASTSLPNWPISKAFDKNASTVWSSEPGGRQWIAYWFSSGYNTVNYVRLQPRFSGGQSYCFPVTFTIFGNNESGWVKLRTVTNLPPPTIGNDVYISVPAMNCKGIHVVADTLGDNGGGPYFQLAEAGAGYNANYAKGKKVYADYHAPRYTRKFDGASMGFSNWSHAGYNPTNGNVAVYDQDVILSNSRQNIAAVSSIYPILGVGSDSDKLYLQAQILSAMTAGIDGFMVESINGNDPIITKMLEICEENDYPFEIGVNFLADLYFSPGAGGTLTSLQGTIQSFLNNVYSSRKGAHHNGSDNPIILFFGDGSQGAANLYSYCFSRAYSNVLGKRQHQPGSAHVPFFIPILWANSSSTFAFDDYDSRADGRFTWSPSIRGNDYNPSQTKIDQFAINFSARDNCARLKIAGAMPGFDDTPCNGWDQWSPGYMARNNGVTLKNQIANYAYNRSNLDHMLIATWSDWTEDTQVAGSHGDRGNYRELATISKYAPAFKFGGTWDANRNETKWPKRTDSELEAPYIWGQDVQRMQEYKTMGFSDSHNDIALLRNRLNQLQLNIASGDYAAAAAWANQARAKRNYIDANLVKTSGSSYTFPNTAATSKWVKINIPADDSNLGKPGFVQTYLSFNYKYAGNIKLNNAVNETDTIRVKAAPSSGLKLAGTVHRLNTGTGTKQVMVEIPQNLINQNKADFEYYIETSGAPLQITGLSVVIYRSTP